MKDIRFFPIYFLRMNNVSNNVGSDLQVCYKTLDKDLIIRATVQWHPLIFYLWISCRFYQLHEEKLVLDAHHCLRSKNETYFDEKEHSSVPTFGSDQNSDRIWMRISNIDDAKK